MGVHYIGPGPFIPLQEIAYHCRLPLAAILNEPKAVQWLKALSPETTILYRITGQDGGLSVAKVQSLLDQFQFVAADYFSLANEWLPFDTPALLALDCSAYMVAMDIANEYGLKITVGDLNTGHPNLRNPANLQAMRPMLAKAEREGHALNVHYYAREADPLHDPDALIWKEIVKDYPELRVIIGEYGILENDGTMVSGEAFERLLRFDELLTTQVMGVALYTLTDQTWKQCDFAHELDAFIQHVRNYPITV